MMYVGFTMNVAVWIENARIDTLCKLFLNNVNSILKNERYNIHHVWFANNGVKRASRFYEDNWAASRTFQPRSFMMLKTFEGKEREGTKKRKKKVF